MSNSSKYGNIYEDKIFHVIKNLTYEDSPFTTQKEEEIAHSSSDNDLVCNKGKIKIGIEVKKKRTPDWMQCSLKYINGNWEGSTRGKIPKKSRDIFNEILKEYTIFKGKIPPFINSNITHENWISIKSKTDDWNDHYIDIPDDTISRMYSNKGCYYIQISDLGLYHLGNDIYNFGVPKFICKQEIRIRTKIHKTKNTKGFCSLSVTAACKPKNINKMVRSKYSLDSLLTLPHNLKTKDCKLKMSNKSPLRYPGGKTRACKKLDDIINRYFSVDDIKTLYSPFLGGGSFEFFLQNKYGWDIICNDKYKPLYIFWSVCRDKNKKNILVKRLREKCGYITKEYFKQCREELKNISYSNNDIHIAFLYFIINRCSFSGATMSGGFSLESSKKRFTISSIDRVNNLNLDFKISDKDFTEFIPEFYTDYDSLMFLDPPYLIDSKLYGNNGDLHEKFNHNALYDTIKKHKGSWIMTYNDCKEIRELYKDYTILEVDWKYGMNKTKKSSEIVIMNEDIIYI